MRRDLNALETPPIYCYAGQQNEVAAFCRRTFLMSPLRVVLGADQITEEAPTFFYVKDHLNPVPCELLDFLVGKDALLVRLSK